MPESTMAQRISRVKRTVAGVRVDRMPIVERYDEILRPTDTAVAAHRQERELAATRDAPDPRAGRLP